MGRMSIVLGEDYAVLAKDPLDPVEGNGSFMMTGPFYLAADPLPVRGMALGESPLQLPDGLVETKSADDLAAVME